MTNKSTILLIFLLGLTAVFLLYLSFSLQKKAKPPAVTRPIVTAPKKTAVISFNPNNFSLVKANSTYTAYLFIDSGESSVTGAQIELSYNPALLQNVVFTPASNETAFFKTSTEHIILQNIHNSKTGKISSIIALFPNVKAIKGTGLLGTLTFKTTVPSKFETKITFQPGTAVSTQGKSVSILKEALPLEISK